MPFTYNSKWYVKQLKKYLDVKGQNKDKFIYHKVKEKNGYRIYKKMSIYKMNYKTKYHQIGQGL